MEAAGGLAYDPEKRRESDEQYFSRKIAYEGATRVRGRAVKRSTRAVREELWKIMTYCHFDF
jgi:hypothetical protein